MATTPSTPTAATSPQRDHLWRALRSAVLVLVAPAGILAVGLGNDVGPDAPAGKARTPWSVGYLHGSFASRLETAPRTDTIARWVRGLP